MSTSNYTLGMCELWFAYGAHDDINKGMFRHLGNIVAGEVTPDITYLEHYKSIEGDRRKDKTVAITKAISIPFTFDEINVDNLNDFFYSLALTPTQSAVMQKTSVPIEGRAILRLKTAVGTSFSYTIPKCVLKADGGLALNAEDWITGKFTLEVLNTSTYTIPDDTSYSAPYGYLLTDLSASAGIDACEAGWIKGPCTTATKVQVTNTTTYKTEGTKSTQIRIATYWNYVTASGVAGMNCLAYKKLDIEKDITPYSFIELSVRASRDFSASTLYLGFESTATPIGAPIDYVALNALSSTKTFETQMIPIKNRNAGLTQVNCVGIYGTSKVDVSSAASVQTVWIDNIRCKN